MEGDMFKIGDKVTDKDGFQGYITRITEHDECHWYDVRFYSGQRIVGEAVRYEADLIYTSETY